MITSMSASYLLNVAIALFTITAYYRGWSSLSRKWPKLVSWRRLFLFVAGVGLLVVAINPPLTTWAGYYLSVRSVQKVLISMVIPPMLWSSLPLHVIAHGFTQANRDRITRGVIRSSKSKAFSFNLSRPGTIWLIFTSIFLIWHEPTLANWLLSHYWVNHLFSWFLFTVSLLIWSQIVGTLPRIHRTAPGWSLIVTLIAVEIPNMAAGMTVAFAKESIYAHYANLRLINPSVREHQFVLTLIGDQQLSGCITWIGGSIVYVTAIILVLNRLFKEEKLMPPRLSFTQEADERTIAPGLEHRVYQNRWRQIDDSPNV